MQHPPPDQEQSDYYHKVVDCQYACPAHTPVPQYIRLIAEGRYQEAYRLNRLSNVFPGILGRVCDRPCEPACRRGRLGEEPVAICRLKRAAADFRGNEGLSLPLFEHIEKSGKKIALIGAGPASLTVADDLMTLGYECHLFEKEALPGGAMRSQVPAFRLPEAVLNEELDSVISRGLLVYYGHEVRSLRAILDQGFDAVFVGTGAPLPRQLNLPGFEDLREGLYHGVHFLANVAFGHLKRLAGKTLVIGGGNTAMDCSRTALRCGSDDVVVIAPEKPDAMLASPWEQEDALREGVRLMHELLPLAFLSEDGHLTAVRFRKVKRLKDADGRWNPLFDEASAPVDLPCQQVILAIGQDLNLDFVRDCPEIRFQRAADGAQLPLVELDSETYQSGHPKVFFGGDAAFGPRNIIHAVADGHEAAISIDRFCRGLCVSERPALSAVLTSQKMGLHQWSYDNHFAKEGRHPVPAEPEDVCVRSLHLEVEQGFSRDLAAKEAARCLNCDVQTVFQPELCIECDACIDICPVECLMLTQATDDETLRQRFPRKADNHSQAIFSAAVPQTDRLMVKDENHCLHCGLCAERCPTAAWDMQSLEMLIPRAGDV